MNKEYIKMPHPLDIVPHILEQNTLKIEWDEDE